MANRGAHAVHRRITTAEHYDIFSCHINEWRLVVKFHHFIGVGDQKRQCIINAGGVFVG
ncbi:Uncharacterised protein [Vibrio cholerae]|nr:Uncharacterised protein [Vibrio cholerae]CSC81144.1 Uncharacterised protein [Vibrio cholerae]